MNGSEGYNALSERAPAMNFETMYTDVAPVTPSPRENSNESGTTLKEHDYIGLSEVSSANSSSETHPGSGRGEALDLNESATVLRLGPPAVAKPDARELARDVREWVADPEFAKPAVRAPQRNNAILEEFRKAQALKAASQRAPPVQLKSANPNLPMYHRPKEYEAGQKGGYPTSFHASYNVFPGVKSNGMKRGFSETVGMHLTAREGHCDVNRGEGMGMGMGGTEQPDVKVKLQQEKTWMGCGSHNPYNVQRRAPVQDAGDSSNKVSNEAKKHSLNEAMASASNDQPSSPAQNQTVGWPPVRSFVRQTNFGLSKPAPPPPASTTACPSVQEKDTPSSTNSKSCFVKIYMDGVPFGRKVDLKTNNRYEKLYSALEEMFQQFISGHYSGSQTSSSSKNHFVSSSSRKLNFLDGSEYVLIYEDHEGDFMLVGDVPWELFVNTVKRLRIMKGSEEVNLAPKNADPVKTQPAVG
ncbi:hypothetical protein M758_3G053200 [Ceratodon purpureus]|uniref:Auxin-responsive protein n=1 Tax=Ceratodon purpureus TaxID=3225 RepID=A0A8T0IHJ3_CERPU|nr:hypothetical protein KC19_3G055200 [Ceratodon purpureus]KAG0621858.1 hypothetical protein M758_3G053200 [Ceratodon purpureus]